MACGRLLCEKAVTCSQVNWRAGIPVCVVMGYTIYLSTGLVDDDELKLDSKRHHIRGAGEWRSSQRQ